MQAEATINDELQRISQLRDYSINLNSAKAYFRANDDKLTNPSKRQFFVALESEFQGLDDEAWQFLKGEAMPRLKSPHPTRRWQQLFDTLNEAKGYNHLARIGCTDIKFIPRATTNKVQTPDLRGLLGVTRVLCEVKRSTCLMTRPTGSPPAVWERHCAIWNSHSLTSCPQPFAQRQLSFWRSIKT